MRKVLQNRPKGSHARNLVRITEEDSEWERAEENFRAGRFPTPHLDWASGIYFFEEDAEMVVEGISRPKNAPIKRKKKTRSKFNLFLYAIPLCILTYLAIAAPLALPVVMLGFISYLVGLFLGVFAR